MTDASNPAEPSFSEIDRLIDDLPDADLESATSAASQLVTLMPGGQAGDLGDLAVWLARWQGRTRPDLRRPRVSLFAAGHGFAVDLAADPVSTGQEEVARFTEGDARTNALCQAADADLRVYDLSIEIPSADARRGDALSEEDCARAVTYGMVAVEQGVDLHAFSDASLGSAVAATAIAALLMGARPADHLADGSKELAICDAIVETHRGETKPLEILRKVGGLEIAALVGAGLATRFARQPMLVDGIAAFAAVGILGRLDARSTAHIRPARPPRTPVERLLLANYVEQAPCDFRLGTDQGFPSAAAIPVLGLAAAILDTPAG
ncbi:MAG: nicotinate-nucleotide--dimethylbenzimidazole phosphoribosyltransferase [Alphaproteobacteria bacterium]|nr:nicotinate-nucleotide--dimethylbenzimidazole phosphoribosyltransferase [Alphaproteobacteria bacterium]